MCGNPAAPCRSSKWKFQPYDLSFRLPPRLKWLNNYDSASFYAVILKTRKAVPAKDVESECAGFFTEPERRKVQSMFTRNKVFASRMGCNSPGIGYTGVDTDNNFLAVYAGETQAAADAFLQKVKVNGQFPEASVKQMKVVLDYGD